MFNPIQKYKQEVQAIIFTYGLNMLWVGLVVTILMFIHNEITLKELFNTGWFIESKPSRIETFFYACIMAPVYENLLYLISPIIIAQHFKIQSQIIPITVAIVFGLAHGSVDNILIQGFLGYTWILMYKEHGTVPSIINHALWNIFVLYSPTVN